MMMACKNRAIAAVHGRDAVLWQDIPGNGNSRRASCRNVLVASIQVNLPSCLAGKAIYTVSGDQNHESVFVGRYLPDHPQATSEDDLNALSRLITEFRR